MARRWFKILLIYTAILFAIGLAILGFDVYRLFYTPMLSINASSDIVTIDKHTTASSFVHTLKKQHLIRTSRLFLLMIRIQGLSHQLKAGIYQIHQGESAEQFLSRIIQGDVLKLFFKIIEGTTAYQVEANLTNAPYLNYLASDWHDISAHHLSAEGLLLADTYLYNAGSQASDLLARAHTNLLQQLEISWKNRDKGLPYKSSYQLLITASILEKEASKPAEKRLIAGVIVNRLQKYMPLQMDPTVIYALGPQFHGLLSRADLGIDSPYNTYRYRGLPPTPIAMVGKDALDAAAHPTQSNYLYFFAKGDGSHQFSETYEEHKKAIERFTRK